MKEKIAIILNKYTSLCWADLVSWFLGTKKFKEVITNQDHIGCIAESKEHSTNRCYCGKYYKGYNVKNLPEHLENEIKQPVTINQEEHDLPF